MNGRYMLNRRVARRLLVGAMWLLLLSCYGRSRAAEPAAAVDGAPSAAADAPAVAETDSRGVPLGEFRIRVYHPVEGQKSTATFTLYARVAGGNSAEFEQLLEHRQHKVRDQVITATRLAPLADYDDPSLSEFRRRILLRLRRMLPELPVDDIYVSNFELEVRARTPNDK